MNVPGPERSAHATSSPRRLSGRARRPAPRSGLLYDYLLAGDGLWLAAENAALRVRAPVALAEVRGLPGALWAASVAVARAAATRRHEVLLLVLHGPAGYRLVVPEDQIATPTSVVYTPPLLAVGEAVVLASTPTTPGRPPSRRLTTPMSRASASTPSSAA